MKLQTLRANSPKAMALPRNAARILAQGPGEDAEVLRARLGLYIA